MNAGAALAIAAGGAIAVIGGAIVVSRRSSSLGRARGKSKAAAHAGAVRKGRSGAVLRGHRSAKMPIKERLKLLQELTAKSVQDPDMRKLALKVTSGCVARDDTCEARAVGNWVKNNVRYTGDIAPHRLWAGGPVESVDLYQAARRTVEFQGGDCLPEGTLLLCEDNVRRPIENVLVGTRIWGLNDWTTVVNVWWKDTLAVDRVVLDNGRDFEATGDHKVYVARCKLHDTCSCSMETRELVRLHVKELRAGMLLAAPGERIIHVTDIERSVAHKTVYDISTKDHYVYLPEADVTVSNCDDHSVLNATLLILNGIQAKFRVTSPYRFGSDNYTHIYTMAGLPKNDPTKWVAVDTTLPDYTFGKEYSFAKNLDVTA